jgi:hypothetical protein
VYSRSREQTTHSDCGSPLLSLLRDILYSYPKLCLLFQGKNLACPCKRKGSPCVVWLYDGLIESVLNSPGYRGLEDHLSVYLAYLYSHVSFASERKYENCQFYHDVISRLAEIPHPRASGQGGAAQWETPTAGMLCCSTTSRFSSGICRPRCEGPINGQSQIGRGLYLSRQCPAMYSL